jgi:hypothetical protein
MQKQSRHSWMIPVTGGLALALLMIGATVSYAITTCAQCNNYWGYWAANTTTANGGCSDYKSYNQSNNKGTCIIAVQTAHCKAICDANPVTVPVTACEGEAGIQTACDIAIKGGKNCVSANGPCTQSCWDANCQTNSSKLCRLVQVNQNCNRIMASVCYVNCGCSD